MSKVRDQVTRRQERGGGVTRSPPTSKTRVKNQKVISGFLEIGGVLVKSNHPHPSTLLYKEIANYLSLKIFWSIILGNCLGPQVMRSGYSCFGFSRPRQNF